MANGKTNWRYVAGVATGVVVGGLLVGIAEIVFGMAIAPVMGLSPGHAMRKGHGWATSNY